LRLKFIGTLANKMVQEDLSRERIAEYASMTGLVQYWAGAFHTAIISRNMRCRWATAQNLAGVIKEYKENVPEDLRKMIDIKLDELEALVADIQK